MRVAEKHLKGQKNQRQPHGERQAGSRKVVMSLAEKKHCRDSSNHEYPAHETGVDHVQETIWKGRIENDRHPIGNVEYTIMTQDSSLRRLHPTVGRQDPKSTEHCAECYHDRGKHMHPAADEFLAE